MQERQGLIADTARRLGLVGGSSDRGSSRPPEIAALALDLKSPDASTGSPVRAESKLQDLRLRRLDLLGGLIHEYEIPAAA
jgi:hypothetical protein